MTKEEFDRLMERARNRAIEDERFRTAVGNSLRELLDKRRAAEPSVPFDCKNHVAAKCPTCIAVWARTAENRGEKP